MKGKFDLSGATQLTVPRKGQSSLSVSMQLDLTSGSHSITGTISSTNFTAQLLALRVVFNVANPATNFAGNYVTVIGGSTNAAVAPPGYGYALHKINRNGLVAFSGSLPDGTAISGAGPLLKGGTWPLYARLYNGQGSFIAWANFDSSSEHVEAPFPLWFKNPTATGKLYRDGFSLSGSALSMEGIKHVTPVKGASYFNYTNGVVYLTDGNLPTNTTNSITVSSNNLIAVTSGTNHLSVSLNVNNGVFIGSFIHPATGLRTVIKGVIPANVGFGYFLGTNQSGSVIIESQ